MARKIEVSSPTNPELMKKLRTNIKDDTDIIYWYIRFNTTLDPTTVSSATMNVTDTYGYIMRTNISYNRKRHMIGISPLDSYLENVYYLLNISGSVRSSQGVALKRDIHILFKLINNVITEFEILKSTVKVPKPRPRPHNYDAIMAQPQPPVPFLKQDQGNETLRYQDINISILPGMIGAGLVAVSYLLGINILVGVSILICFGGIGHIILQLTSRKLRSALSYNRGVRNFNLEQYEKAMGHFQKAAAIDKDNQDAHYAMKKTDYFI